MVEQLKGFQQHVKDTYVLKKIFRFATFATYWEILMKNQLIDIYILYIFIFLAYSFIYTNI